MVSQATAKVQLAELNPDERAKYVSDWKERLQRLPQSAYVAQLTRLTRQFGPEFASELIQPELITENEPEPVTKVPAAEITPTAPWYQKPLVWANEQPTLKPIFKGLNWYQQRYLTPAALSVAQLYSPQLRQQLGGVVNPFALPIEQRQQIWEEAELPWLAKTATEMLVDPTSYIGWGIPGAAKSVAMKAGLTGLAKAIQPAVKAEEVLGKVATLPIKGAGAAIRAIPVRAIPTPVSSESWIRTIAEAAIGGKPKIAWRKPLEESPKSVARNLTIHTTNALSNLVDVGSISSINKPLSQILVDVRLGTIDPALTTTITNPKQQQIIQSLIKHKDALNLDELIPLADKNTTGTAAMLGQRLIKAMAPELGLPPPRLLTGNLASFERYSQKLYDFWKKSVLFTPFYVVQNIVENVIRPIFIGANPFDSLSDYAKMPSLAKAPIEIQNLMRAIHTSLGKPIPEGLSKFAPTLELGGMTEASIGSLVRGKPYMPLGAAALADQGSMVRVFRQEHERIVRDLMEITSPETQAVSMEIRRIYGDAIKSFPTESEQRVQFEHLQDIALTHSLDDAIHEFNIIQKTKHLAVARPMTDTEKALPDIIRQRIAKDIPTAWTKNSTTAMLKVFSDTKKMLPLYVQEYQRAQLIGRLRELRNLLRGQANASYRTHITQILKKYVYPRASEAESRLAAAKTLTEYEDALFKCHLEARRELEFIAEETIEAEMVAKNIDPKVVGQWRRTATQINDMARASGDTFLDKVRVATNVIRFAKDPNKIKQAWDGIIMDIQSSFPDQAEAMRLATPDNDLLWHTYRKVQELRWFNVGEEKLLAAQNIAGVTMPTIPAARDATGKVITMEDYMQEQSKAVDSWSIRALETYEHRVDTATPRDKLLNGLREQTIKLKEGMALQEQRIQNQADDMAMDKVYATFGNYASRTNLDEFMTSMGVPFWFFPSRSIPFYTTQMLQKPRLGAEVLDFQRSKNESEQPARLVGSINIPGTDYWYNPLQSSMLWQMVNQQSFTPAATGGLEQGMNWMRNNLSISLGPQWRVGAALVERVMAKQAGTTPLTGEPQPLIPQTRWLEAISHKKLPLISPAAGLLNEPFDMYLRAVYGNSVAEWSQREVEKTIVDMGYNPQTAPKEIIERAWDRYYTRQLLSIPSGAVKEMTPTELARFEAINQQSKAMGLTKAQVSTLQESGESKYTGLRQDQLDTIYKDIPAQKLWRYIRPYGLTAKSKPIWQDYIDMKLGREELLYGTDPTNPTKSSRLANEQNFDKALQSMQISPKEWKSLYRQNYQEYIDKVQQLETDYPLAPKTDTDWEAYRELLGWKEQVRHPDDIKLDEYYKEMDSAKFENDLGEFDYDAYREAEQQFFQGLPQETIDYIKSRKDKYKTPLRAAYSRDMAKAQPYYDLQDAMLVQYPPEISTLIDLASKSPDPAIQRAIMVGNPQALILMRKIRLAKAQLRAKNPELDRLLRYWSS